MKPATVNISSPSSNYDSIVSSTIANPIQLSGINYNVNDQQFANISFIRNDVNGAGITIPTIPDLYRRNTQFNPNLLTLKTDQPIDGETAVRISLTASQLVTLSFFLKATFNRVS